MHALRAYRDKTGKTQEQLAQELGVSELTVWRWEKGTRKIRPSLLATVSEKTGIPKTELRPDLAEILGSAA